MSVEEVINKLENLKARKEALNKAKLAVQLNMFEFVAPTGEWDSTKETENHSFEYNGEPYMEFYDPQNKQFHICRAIWIEKPDLNRTYEINEVIPTKEFLENYDTLKQYEYLFEQMVEQKPNESVFVAFAWIFAFAFILLGIYLISVNDADGMALAIAIGYFGMSVILFGLIALFKRIDKNSKNKK